MSAPRTIPAPDNTDLSTYTILVDGEEISGEYQVALVSVTLGVNSIATAQVSIFDGDTAKETFEVSSADVFIPGKEIELKLGYHSQEDSVFKGLIIKHGLRFGREGRPVLVVECKDAAVKMTVGRKNAYFFESTDSDIIEEIAGTYSGLSPEVESTSVTHAEMVQYYATDWDFVVARAEMNEMLVYNRSNALIVAKPELGAPVLTLLYGATMFSCNIEMDARTQYGAANGTSWDFAEQSLLEIEGEDPGLDEAGNISASKLTDVIGLDQYQAQHAGQVRDEELQAWTNTILRRSRLAKIRGRVQCQGFAGIVPGDTLELAGLGDRFNGPVFVAGVKHQLSAGNWTTDIEFGYSPKWFHQRYQDIMECEASGLLPGIKGLHTGIVVALEGDPDGEDRIQVRMPLVSVGEDGLWARIATLDAGEERGFVFRPEIDDEVVLGFMNGDPRDPVVLGAFHSSAKPAPIAASDDNHEKGYVTRGGMRFVFDDDKNSITFETPNGNTVVLSEDSGSILVEDENGNKIELSSGGILLDSAADIELKATGDVKISGTNVEIEAQAQLKAAGSAGAEFSSSANAILKGAMVFIN